MLHSEPDVNWGWGGLVDIHFQETYDFSSWNPGRKEFITQPAPVYWGRPAARAKRDQQTLR